jgi:oxygen-dependent protoporphyrinogen oxidase
VVVRASVGRFGEDHAARDGTWLRGVAAAEVSEVAGSHRALLDSVITRWQPALPQYLIGHPARVASTREGLPAGVFIAGAAWDGVGLPAVVASARRAAAQAADWSHEH